MQTVPPNVPIPILLVDDFALWRQKLTSLLQGQASLQIVGEAESGRDAIEKAQLLQPDLILLDIGLPDMSGVRVAERIYQLSPKSKIIFVTQHDDAELANLVTVNGVHGYLLKQYIDRKELLSAITAVLCGKRCICKQLRCC